MNKVSLWRFDQTQILEGHEKEGLREPVLVCDAPHSGNVTGLEVSL